MAAGVRLLQSDRSSSNSWGHRFCSDATSKKSFSQYGSGWSTGHYLRESNKTRRQPAILSRITFGEMLVTNAVTASALRSVHDMFKLLRLVRDCIIRRTLLVVRPLAMVRLTASKALFLAISVQMLSSSSMFSRLIFFSWRQWDNSVRSELRLMDAMLKSRYWSRALNPADVGVNAGSWTCFAGVNRITELTLELQFASVTYTSLGQTYYQDSSPHNLLEGARANGPQTQIQPCPQGLIAGTAVKAATNGAHSQ